MVVTITIIVLISAALGIGTSNLYFSRMLLSTNHQFSYAQLKGYQFLMDFMSSNGGKIYSSVPNTKTIFALGPYSDQLRKLQTAPIWNGIVAPEHFGYLGEPDRLEQQFDDPEYLTVTSFDMSLYQVERLQGQFSPNDFALLEYDARWHKVYDSGDFTLRVWREE